MLKITTFACPDVAVYTVSMSFKVSVKVGALVYATLLVLFAVSQLFGFEDFQLLVDSFWLPGGESFANFLAGFIVVVEVFALPFLLRMKVSPLMRVVSMVAGWLVPLIWLGLSLWLLFTINAVTNIGLLGTLFALEPSIGTVFVGVVLAALAIWVSLGMRSDSLRTKR